MTKEKKNQKNNETMEKTQTKEITLTGSQVAEMLNAERAKLNAINQNLNNLQNAIIEIKGCINALQELAKQKNAKTMVPLGAGVFVEASIENVENVKASLPGNIIIQQSREKTIKDLEKQIQELNNKMQELQKEFQQAAENANNLEKIIRTAQQARKT